LENSIEEAETDRQGKLAVEDLVRMFEEAESASVNSRELSERDRDYVDNIQYTAAELKEFADRGQPPTIDNRIKTKVDYLVGLEKTQRIQPKALPRTPKHENDADGASQGIKFVTDEEDYSAKRSAVWRNILVEGFGGVSVSAEECMDYNGQPGIEVKVRRWSWDRLFYDPHSAEVDFSDAGYLGGVLWMDETDALEQYKDNPEAASIVENTILSATMSQTYDDKPKFSVWADRKRKRIRIVVMWLKRGKDWYFAEYTKGGILKAGPSPYKTDKGESDGEMILQSAYVDRDNNRYGLVREMITLQDEINKRRSKSLHLLNVSQIVYEDGAVEDINDFHRQSVRPDGKMKVNPGALKDKRVQFNTRTDLATAHFQLLEEAKAAIDLKGPNATEMGDKTGGSNAASGKAIIASQQGGMIQVGDLMDNLRHLDKRVFRAIWNRIRQFWTAEKWIRVTDDQQNVKWVVMNADPQQMQMLMAQNPEAAKKIAGMVANVAELDCDIIIDEAPDSLTPQLEQFQSLVELKKYDAKDELPFKAIVAAMPNLKGKDSLLDQMGQPNPAAQQAEQIQLQGAQAKVAETAASAGLKDAQRIKTLADAGQQPGQEPGKFELPPELQVAQAAAEINDKNASATHKRAQAAHISTQAMLAPVELAAEHHHRNADRDQQARQASQSERTA
jgi:hypothetical protein